MKGLVLLFFLLTSFLAAPTGAQDMDDGCHMEWVTIYADSPSSTSSATTPSAVLLPNNKKASKVASKSDAKATVPTGSGARSTTSPLVSGKISSASDGGSSTNNADEPGFPIDGQHLSAPEASDAVPDGAAIYTPPGKSFSGKAFATWWTEKKDANPGTKWVKITPGVYDLSVSDGIAVGFTPGGWTLDLRGVTFLVAPDIPDNTSGQAIYINQSEDMTILGGTVWFDQGEQWSQAKVTSITPIDEIYSTATFAVEEGYKTSVWNTADPRNQGCVDTSDANHYIRPDCNFFYADQYDFSGLTTSKRTFTSRITPRSNIKVGLHITMIAGPNSRTTIASEFNGGLHVNGMTSNGGLAQYGLEQKSTATFENVWNVNPPARPGYAPRVQGPTLSQGHIGLFDFNADGQAAIIYKNCWWQTTGSMKDVQDMGDQELH